MSDIVVADLDRRIKVIAGPGTDAPSIERVSRLREYPFVVLLGEPGIGKSTVLSREAAREGTVVISVRALMTGAEPPSNAPLFLDALDEYRTDGGIEDKVHMLANAITKSNRGRWRLTCRSEDWRKAADIEPIGKAAAGHPITVAQLLPLDVDEALAILAALDEPDPERFVSNAQAYGATAFMENPLGLRLLQRAVKDGGVWPVNRFELFTSAISKLAFERSAVRNLVERHSPDQILNAAGETCLLLLLSGARAVWRSNNEPPSGADVRAYVPQHHLQIARGLLDDMLDTPLFRGEGEAFEPLHKTVAEFLAAKTLSRAVISSPLSLDRALALATGSDGHPPTELRGLFAWFAAHLAKAGDTGSALRLVKTDPVTILSYGDAAVFDTPTRRNILNGLGQADPFFRASDVGVTAVSGLAGEDLAADFARTILAEPGEATHRLMTVFEALTLGRPVLSLRPVLCAFALDATRPEWARRRAIEAYLNGADEPARLRRELFDTLSSEAASISREAIRAQLAADFAPGDLTVADVLSVLADYRRSKPDNVMGRLYGLMNRLETQPMPELFDIPTKSWLPLRNGNDRDHGYEINHLLDRALASAIRSTVDLAASRLWHWLTNVRREPWSALKDQTKETLIEWLDARPEREVALFDEILADAAAGDGPWIAPNKFVTVAQRHPSAAITRHLLKRAAETGAADRQTLLAVAVEIAVTGQDEGAYWETYDQVEQTDSNALLDRLTVSHIESWRRENAERNAKALEEEERQRVKSVEILEPIASKLAIGLYPSNLDWAARLFFERSGVPSALRILHATNQKIADAILAGWRFLARNGLGGIDAAKLGKAEAEQKRYYVEAAAIAGIYELLNCGEPPLDGPLEVPLAVLKSSWIVNGEDRRKMVDQWAAARLNTDPSAGADQLIAFWNGAIDAGSGELPGLWQLIANKMAPAALKEALAKLVLSRPSLPPHALRSAVRASAKVLDKAVLIDAARLACENGNISDIARQLWMLIAWVLDPAGTANLSQANLVELFLDDGNSELIGAICGMATVDSLPAIVLTIRSLGPRVSPRDEWSSDGQVLEPQRRSEKVRHSINALSSDGRFEAAEALTQLANDPDLIEWFSAIRHAQAQQRRLMRDQNFRHPTPASVRAALHCGPPVNASDLRAVVTAELRQLRAELRTTDTQPWKKYWNRDGHGKVTEPLIENECRDHLLERLRDRLGKYQIAAALPEARRGEETRADVLILTGAGRNLPVEAKRHFHPDLWIAAATQLQGYAAAPGADGLGIYLVFWFGISEGRAPARPDGQTRPSSGAELEQMLIADLAEDLQGRTDVLVFDVSAPDDRTARTKAKRRRS